MDGRRAAPSNKAVLLPKFISMENGFNGLNGVNSVFTNLDGSRHGMLGSFNGSGLEVPWPPMAVQGQNTSPSSSYCSSSSQETNIPAVSCAASAMTEAGKASSEGDSGDSELFSDIVLKYISDMLMDENLEEKKCMYQECSALQATVKPFYDILGERYPPAECKFQKQLSVDDYHHPPILDSFYGLPNYGVGGGPVLDQEQYLDFGSSDLNYNKIEDSSWIGDLFDPQMGNGGGFDSPLGFSSQLSFSSSGSSTVLDGDQPSPIYDLPFPEFFPEKGYVLPVEEGAVKRSSSSEENGNLQQQQQQQYPWDAGVCLPFNEFNPRLPKSEPESICSELKPLQQQQQQLKADISVTSRKRNLIINGIGRTKNVHSYEVDLEDRPNSKHTALSSEDEIRTDRFDEVLLCQGLNGKNFSEVQKEVLNNGVSKSNQTDGPAKPQVTKGRGKNKGKKEVVDLRALLIHCAQAVSSDDTRGANDILKQIKQHASQSGDGSQRLAHYFAESLEARLNGTGGQIYTMQWIQRFSAAEILKAYQLYLVATPFKKISHFVSNQTIIDLVENSTGPRTLHIVDFGILYGFQWPCLIQRLGGLPGGPPRLRITGIDFPQPGFKPAQRIEETGKRLKAYAESFGVPFEYKPIATSWENVNVEDLELGGSDEILAVNCMFRMRNLMDETVVVGSPRNIVLNKIKSMRPNVFIHGVVSGAYNAPFFITRFREALFHFSALFDAFEAIVPRDHPERLVLEGEILGREILNVLACEGLERMERPETCKQWQARTQRAGFRLLPLNKNILSRSRERVRTYYHKDFVVDQDGQWLLLGWKGRIINAISSWVPVS